MPSKYAEAKEVVVSALVMQMFHYTAILKHIDNSMKRNPACEQLTTSAEFWSLLKFTQIANYIERQTQCLTQVPI